MQGAVIVNDDEQMYHVLGWLVGAVSGSLVGFLIGFTVGRLIR